MKMDIYILKKVFKEILLCKYGPGFSSVGRAFDCSSLSTFRKGGAKYVNFYENMFCSTFFKSGCGYQNVAGSNPASRKNILINIFY